MTSIYPFLQTVKYIEGVSDPAELPLFIDAKWNDADGCAELDERGEPIMVSGMEAIQGWIFRTLRTQRYAEEFYTFEYGSEVMDLIGRNWSKETRLSEAERYIKEALLQNPYIISVEIDDLAFENCTLTVSLTARTVYADIRLEVSNV